MNEKGFASIILSLLIVASIAAVGYLALVKKSPQPMLIPNSFSTSTPTSTIPTSTSTPTSTPTPTTVEKVDLRSSLLAITILHTKDAAAIASGAEPFDIETSLDPDEINTGNVRLTYAASSFILPNSDIKYIRVNEWFDNQVKRNYATSSGDFIVRNCSGGAPPPPEFGCGQPTGEPESREKHLPIKNWITDIKDVALILKGSGAGSSRGGKIVVATIGRLKSKYSDFFPQSLRGFPNAQTVIEFIEEGVRGAATDFSEVGQYMVLDAGKGKILAKGNYKLPPPAP